MEVAGILDNKNRLKLLKDLDVSGKRVFLRADLDVPVAAEQVHHKLEAETATRLTNIKPTFKYLRENGASQIIIAGHMGRPKGHEDSFSTKQLIEPLQNILGVEIAFKEQLEGEAAGQIILLENLRFWEGEEKNDLEFAKQLSQMADCYINDAFGNCHRAHASMVALSSLLPHAAGLHLEEEVNQMTRLIESPEKPFVAIVGGAKIETKLPVISNLAKIADWVLVGGELPVEIEKQDLKFGGNVLVGKLEDDNFDVTIESTLQFGQHLKNARTIVWNGPMGFFEEGHNRGTLNLAKAIVESGAFSVVGGGDTTQFLEQENLLSKFSFVSAGGGAMLEFLAGHILPGIEALQ